MPSLRSPSRSSRSTAVMLVVALALAYLAGLFAGDPLAAFVSEAWRRIRPPSPQQGFKRQGDLAEPKRAPRESSRSESDPSPEQRREIEALRSMAYVSGTQPPADAVGVTVHDRERAWAGLNLLVDTHGPEAVLMDMEGRALHRWRHPYVSAFPDSTVPRGAEGVQYWRRVELLEGGGLLALFEGAGLIRLDHRSELVWAFDEAAHHDLEVQADGSIYVLTRDAAIRPRFHRERPVTDDFVVVLSASGEVVRRISILEAIRRSDYRGLLDLAEPHGDLLHTNTIEVLDGRHSERLSAFAAGNVLLSFPKINTLAVLDPGHRRIVWALTGMTAYQHDPTLLEDGRLLVFDNWGDTGGHSRILEIDPLTLAVAWRYEGSRTGFYTECCGTNQRLANGNTLITETDRGRAFEVTRSGEIVWEFVTPHRVGRGGDELVARLFDVRRLEASAASGWLEKR